MDDIAVARLGESTTLEGVFRIISDHLGIMPGVRLGRVPAEGYQRGWALQYGGLLPIVEADPLYRHSLDTIDLASWLSPEKRANLFLLITRFLPALASRNIVEFGSYRGGTALFMALVLREVAPEATVYALDTFEGMPETEKAIDAHSSGEFADTSLEALQSSIARLGLINLFPIKGRFERTFPALQRDLTFGLAHIDADIYSAIRYAQNAVWPRMTKGGYVVHDDATTSSCIGATQAVEEFIQERRVFSEQVWPHTVFRAGLAAPRRRLWPRFSRR